MHQALGNARSPDQILHLGGQIQNIGPGRGAHFQEKGFQNKHEQQS